MSLADDRKEAVSHTEREKRDRFWKGVGKKGVDVLLVRDGAFVLPVSLLGA